MEKIGATNPEYQPCAPTLEKPSPGTNSPINFTKQMVPSLCPESLTQSLSRSFSPVLCVRLIKGFLPPKTFLHVHRFFFVSLFHFHRTLFRGLAGACVNPASIFSNSLFMHSLLCQIPHSFLS